VPERIGLIQTRAIGDIIIALPIADYFIDRGDEVYWPIDGAYLRSFQEVKPEIHFISVEPRGEIMYQTPLAQLRQLRCDRIISLYNALADCAIVNQEGRTIFRQKAVVDPGPLAGHMKFDEYKYAAAGVPFAKKWDLRLSRNMPREMELHERLSITRPYICRHVRGSNFCADFEIPADWQRDFQIIDITELTDSPFDWIYTLEHASKLLLIDSCFANLVEQLNLPVEKYLALRNPVTYTPVMRNQWTFIAGAHPQTSAAK